MQFFTQISYDIQGFYVKKYYQIVCFDASGRPLDIPFLLGICFSCALKYSEFVLNNSPFQKKSMTEPNDHALIK